MSLAQRFKQRECFSRGWGSNHCTILPHLKPSCLTWEPNILIIILHSLQEIIALTLSLLIALITFHFLYIYFVCLISLSITINFMESDCIFIPSNVEDLKMNTKFDLREKSFDGGDEGEF